ncbi:hypothetical protein SSPO_024450 [Streptomyces antimycoticus]|uniref:DJ-1/PfpI domain-containing protein n=1 Tax=Streptomyces antimycoticus TaxID=68175 RepID=A0A499V0M1_9ACTN|nr:hypothetical protein SSPO_024450 [Streptomyces antimycoticus]
MSQVVFVLVPGVHLLDLAGPAQVFDTAADLGLPYELGYVAERELVPTAQGLTLNARTEWPVTGPDDLVVVPGWRISPPHDGRVPGPESLERLCAHHAAGAPWPAYAPGRWRWDGRGCWTAAGAPPTMSCRTSWRPGTPGRRWSGMCCSPPTTGS